MVIQPLVWERMCCVCGPKKKKKKKKRGYVMTRAEVGVTSFEEGAKNQGMWAACPELVE